MRKLGIRKTYFGDGRMRAIASAIACGVFGRAVQPLHFQRRTLSSNLLWRPLREGWEMNAASPDAAVVPMPANLLEHRAVLTLPDGTPFSEFVESYTANVLGFPVPRP